MVRLSKHLIKDKISVKLHEVYSDEDIHNLLKMCKEVEWSEFGVDLSLSMTETFLRVVCISYLI